MRTWDLLLLDLAPALPVFGLHWVVVPSSVTNLARLALDCRPVFSTGGSKNTIEGVVAPVAPSALMVRRRMFIGLGDTQPPQLHDRRFKWLEPRTLEVDGQSAQVYLEVPVS